MNERKYDSTVARIAGNIAGGFGPAALLYDVPTEKLAAVAVDLARAIVAEVKRTEPVPNPPAV